MAAFWLIVGWALALVFTNAASPAQAAREEERRILRWQNEDARRAQPFDYEREIEARLTGGWLTAMRGRATLRDRSS